MATERRFGLPMELLEGVRVVALAAGGSILGYTAAFAYEAGLTGTLDLPITLIQPQLPATVVATATLFFTAVVVYFGLELFVSALRRFKDALVHAFLWNLLPLVLFGLANVFLYQQHWQEWLWTFVPLLVIGAVEFVIAPYLFHPKQRGYRAKVLATGYQHWTESMLIGRLSRRVGAAPFAVLLFVALFLYFAYAVGRSAGLDETIYLVTNDQTPTVVVRIYGPFVITEPYDPSTANPSRQFSVRLVDSAGLVLTSKDVGNLSVSCNVAIGCHSSLAGPVGVP